MEVISLSSNSEDDSDQYFSDDDDGENGSVFVDGIQDFHPSSSHDSSCQVITKESLLEAQRDDLRRVMELLMIREHHARTLLIYYQWNVDKLLTVFIEKGKAHLFAEAGASVSDHDAFGSLSPSSTFTCDICVEDVPYNEATQMNCGHIFCNTCWTLHFTVKVDEGQSRRITCMAYKCKCICDEGIVRNLLNKEHPELADKFDRFLLESYIEDNKMVKWCPSIPHCGNAIRVKEGDALCEVECLCGLQFCFSCLSEPHSPCSCFIWDLWVKKCKDGAESVKWITVHTKNCPYCLKPVQKNGGCNTVRCICGKSFCWICGGKFSYHSCGRYKPSPEVERTKANLYRYTHYYNRYKAHKDSLKLEAKLDESIKTKVSISEEKEPELRDFCWVKDGVYRLFRSRSILSYSYAFAFFMFGDEIFKGEMTKKDKMLKQHLFEDHQQQLEAKVEQLSGLMEAPFHSYTVDKVKEIRLQVIALTGVVNNLCKKLYDFIENDVLGSLIKTDGIAPYKSKGVSRAAELTCQYTNAGNYEYVPSDLVKQGETNNSLSSPGGSHECEDPPPGKRAKLKDPRFIFDLNT